MPYVVKKGEGCFLYFSDGREVLDMSGGLAVNLLGYNNPAVNSAVLGQIHKYIHISNYFYDEQQNKLAGKLLEISGYNKIFFTNSGTEATETAIKIVKKMCSGTERKNFISFRGSFHGRTTGSLTLTGRYRYRDKFLPLLPDVVHVNYNSPDELFGIADNNTAAVIFEAIQGEGGVIPMSESFADALNYLHRKYGFVMIADEIQSGLYRTGDLFAFRHYNLHPDIVLLAKGLGGGLPLGAVLGNQNLRDAFAPGEHGSTFGGNPVACAAGCAVIDEIRVKGLDTNVKVIGDLLMNELKNLQERYPQLITDVRGRGLMIGIELSTEADVIATDLLNKNIFVNVANGNVIRLLPPLILTKEQAMNFVTAFSGILGNY